MSPVAFANTIAINRAPAEVFAYLAAFENIPRWNYAIAETARSAMGGSESAPASARSAPSPTEPRSTSKSPNST
jgi:uncharacterized protein YndB with AHSA1/START domain